MLELWAAMSHGYVGWDYKRRRLGINPDDVFREAIDIELKASDPLNEYGVTLARLEFLDRVRETISKLCDSHLVVHADESPLVSCGLRFEKISEEIVLAGLSSWSSPANGTSRAIVGDALLAIGGSPVGDHLQVLESCISGSSVDARRARAVKCLSERRFLFPHCGAEDFTFRSRSDGDVFCVKVQWRYFPTQSSARVAAVLKGRGFLRSGTSDRSCNSQVSDCLSEALEYSKKYYTKPDGAELAFEAGTWRHFGKVYTVFRLYQMQEYIYCIQGCRFSFSNVFALEMDEIRAAERPLLFDIRHNRGGSGELPMFIASFFVHPAKPQSPCSIMTLRDTDLQNMEVFEKASAPVISEGISGDGRIAVRRRYSSLRARGQDLPMDDGRIFFFDLPTAFLMSTECGSAGDILARLLKPIDNVTLIGSRSHGIGLGYRSGGAITNTWFEDSLGLMRLDIPNQAWGRPLRKSESVRLLDYFDEYWNLILENVQVEPDVWFVPTLKEYLEGDRAWLRRAAAVLA